MRRQNIPPSGHGSAPRPLKKDGKDAKDKEGKEKDHAVPAEMQVPMRLLGGVSTASQASHLPLRWLTDAAACNGLCAPSAASTVGGQRRRRR